MYRTILIPVDDSPLGECPLPYARLIARAAGAPIKLIEVVPRPAKASAQLQAGELELHHAVETYLSDLVRRAAGDLDVEPVVVAGDPAKEIVKAAQQYQADLIILSTHGRSGFGRWIYGSVADAVLRQAPMPVLLVVVSTMEDFGQVADAILNAARESEADLIALTTHGRGRLTRLVFGSHATALVHRAETPLLLVRPKATGLARAD